MLQSRSASDRGAVPVGALLISLAVGVGLVVGSILGFTGAIDPLGESDTFAADTPTAYYQCPGDPSSSGALHRGDRVFATGRDQGASWIQVRSPRSSDARVWIPADDLDPDADLQSLPVVPCAIVVEVAVGTSTTIPGDATTTTLGDTTTTTTASSTTTATLPPPSVGTVSEQRDPIWESYSDAGDCLSAPGHFSTSVIAATITAPAGIQSVTMVWSVGGQNGSTLMSLSAGQYLATLGPFQAEEPSVVPQDQSLPITVTVSVIDSLGRTATRQTTVTLNDCTFG